MAKRFSSVPFAPRILVKTGIDSMLHPSSVLRSDMNPVFGRTINYLIPIGMHNEAKTHAYRVLLQQRYCSNTSAPPFRCRSKPPARPHLCSRTAPSQHSLSSPRPGSAPKAGQARICASPLLDHRLAPRPPAQWNPGTLGSHRHQGAEAPSPETTEKYARVQTSLVDFSKL